MSLFRRKNPKQDELNIASMVHQLNRIYTNRSSDEYKMKGDITKSPVYDIIQRALADITTIKGVNKLEASDLNKMFNVLHRPNFKKIVTDYVATGKASCVMMTATFTCAYRILIGELSRIFTSTVATEKGIIYKPDRISRRNDMSRFVRTFNTRVEGELNKSVRATTKKVGVGSKFKLESYYENALNEDYYQEGGGAVGLGGAALAAQGMANIMDRISPVFEEIGLWCRLLFPDVTTLNPVSKMSSVLSNSYDKKVSNFKECEAMYYATKEAYDEYMKIPQFQRNKKIESKYIKNMEKYNIKMQHAQAKIAHFDQRSIKEAIEQNKIDEDNARASRPEPKVEKSNDGDEVQAPASSNDDFDF